ncbi:hypothetical protein PRUPE_1G119700 [Prunus persica]|uniref:Uncharacterized protein n=1 Tax=Prunus persica TaxID=3760 RepID=A0A251QWB2_PRUPE|nr:hypothetical protein PRUPE_1G119700 [Prunus persica]
MSTGHLFLKPSIGDQKKHGSSEDSKASIDQENSNSSRMSATLQPENETSKRKTNKGRRGSNGFSIVGNTIPFFLHLSMPFWLHFCCCGFW